MSHLNYYVFLETEQACWKCPWKGPGKDFAVGELFDELAEYHCPKCQAMITCQSYPTLHDAKQAWHLLTEKDKKSWLEFEHWQAVRERSKLRSPNELPDIAGHSFALTWNLVDDPETQHSWTVIRHGEREIWREPAVYEGADHFAHIVSILRARYGTALADVMPTGGKSELFLLGDDLHAPAKVLDVRRKLGGGRDRMTHFKRRSRS